MKQDASEFLEELENIRKSNILVIVEGKKDKKALLELGIKNIYVINETGKGIKEKIEGISEKNKEVAILTDFDNEGKKLYNLFRKNLMQEGTKVKDKIRLLMLKLKISHVEGIDSFLENHPR